MKKLIASILILVTVMSAVTAIADSSDEITVILDGDIIEFDVPPIIENDVTLVPMRAIFEALGATVEWYEKFKRVNASNNNGIFIAVSIDENIMAKCTYLIDSEKKEQVLPDFGVRHKLESIELDTPPRIVNDHTLVPLRAISEAFDCDVQWDDDIRTVTITSAVLMETPQPTATPTEVPQCTAGPSSTRNHAAGTGGKPVIYLYPQYEQEVNVKLDLDGKFTFTYPEYNNGWTVTAKPDGTIISDGKEYSYLFWEGEMTSFKPDFKEGFVVKGSESAEFLRATLEKMGLTPREYNEFIVYWVPKLQKNEYNKVYFALEEYEECARLDITPKPDSVLRVFMVYEKADKDVVLPKQELKPFERNGFTVIEWGGYLAE